MALINLLPQTTTKKHKPAVRLKKGAESTTVQISIPKKPLILTACGLLAILLLLFLVVSAKKAAYNSIEKKHTAVNSDYKKLDQLAKTKKERNETLTFLNDIANNKSIWSEKLYLLSKLLSPQIWVRNIAISSSQIKLTTTNNTNKNIEEKTQTIKSLVISGSSTSLMDPEIIASITQFVELLKKATSFNKDLQEIKLGQLQSSKKGNYSVMDFTIYCKFKDEL